MAKQAKFRVFEYTTQNGVVGEIKAPASKVTEKTALAYSPHWIKVQRGIDLETLGDKVVKIVGIK